MSWHFSRALVAEYSAGTCSDGEPFAQSNTTPTPEAYYWPDKTTEHSRLSRFGVTSEPLTADRGEAMLMSFRAAFPAKTSAQPETVPGSMAKKADYGATWRGSLAKYDPASSSWKTAQCSLLTDSGEFSETWPKWGSMRNGECYQRPALAHLTCVNESGLWPTPTCGGFTSRGAIVMVIKKVSNPDEAAAITGRPKVVARLVGANVNYDSANGMLNPDWEEWLMGWPIGWTGLAPLAMAKFQGWLQQHSLNYQEDLNKEAA